MRPEEFQSDAPGRVVKSALGHWTFLPDPLPPTLSYDPRLVAGLSQADRALGLLAGVGQMLPNPQLLIRPYIRREAVLSSKIEGTITRLDQLFLFEEEPEHLTHPADAGEVYNYVRAVEHGLTAVRNGVPFTLQLLCEVHRLLLDGVRGEEKRPGQVRAQAVLIGRSRDFDEARFIPPCHTELAPLLRGLVAFLQSERSLPIIVQLALMHYQFEAIHPFNDGNGRVGRLLITLMLCERGVLPEPLLYLSAFFEQNREEYYDRLLEVSRRGAWAEWIGFVARGVAEQSRDAIERTRRLLGLWKQYRDQALTEFGSVTAGRLVDKLFVTPFLTINRVSQELGVGFKTGAKEVGRLETAGILREVTGQQRYRVFCADEVLRLLDQPLADLPPAVT